MNIGSIGITFGFLIFLGLGNSEAASNDRSTRVVGIARPGCVVSDVANLTPGTPITLLLADKAVRYAAILGDASSCRREGGSDRGYLLTTHDDFEWAIALIGHVPKTYRAHSCDGTEDVHFFLLPGRKGNALWQGWYYLGYDIEPTCTDADAALSGHLTPPGAR